MADLGPAGRGPGAWRGLDTTRWKIWGAGAPQIFHFVAPASSRPNVDPTRRSVVNASGHTERNHDASARWLPVAGSSAPQHPNGVVHDRRNHVELRRECRRFAFAFRARTSAAGGRWRSAGKPPVVRGGLPRGGA